MIAVRRGRPRLEGEDSGMSLIELLVSMLLLSVVLGLVTAGVISGLRSTRGATVRNQNATSASVAADRMTRDLRQAIRLTPYTDATPGVPAVSSATANDIVFTSNLGTVAKGASDVTVGPTQVHFWQGTNTTLCGPTTVQCLFESDTPTTKQTVAGSVVWVVNSTAGTTKVLIRGVVATSGLFTYYCTPTGLTGPAVVFGSSTACDETREIDTVDLFVSVDNFSSPDAPATSVRSRVSMPASDSAAQTS